MTNPSFPPPAASVEPRTPVGEGGDTREALAGLLHAAFCPCGDYAEHERLALDRFNIGSCGKLADAVLAAGYRKVENLGPIEHGAILVFRGVDPSEMQDTFTSAHAVLRHMAGHDDFMLLVLGSDADLLGDRDVVERVAEAIHEADCGRCSQCDRCEDYVGLPGRYMAIARAALAALRGGE